MNFSRYTTIVIAIALCVVADVTLRTAYPITSNECDFSSDCSTGDFCSIGTCWQGACHYGTRNCSPNRRCDRVTASCVTID